MIELGNTYKDRISGFIGVATGFASYISGCNQVLLAPPVTKDSTFRSGEWFDEQRLEIQKAKPIVLDNSRGAGFDKQAPIR